MGSGGLSARQIAGTQHEILMLMMPVYYIRDCVVTPEDIEAVKVGWNLIIKDNTEPYKELKKNKNCEYSSCISWFYSLFYDRLFNVHPACKPLFTSGIVGQGKFLVKMISMTLSQLGDPTHFKQMMEKLAMRHCERGVRAVEFGIVGEVLFFCLMTVTGNEFSREVEHSWKKIYSVMLTHIIPLVIEYERTGVVKRDENSSRTGGAPHENSASFSVVK